MKIKLCLILKLLCFSLLAQPNEKETEAGSLGANSCTEDCPSTQETLSDIQKILQKGTAKPCELASSMHNLREGVLTDYWAQQMVGADLLREELEKADPLPINKLLVAVLDKKRKDHYIHVKNIISHTGPQAVLPDLKPSHLHLFFVQEGDVFKQVAETSYPDILTNLIETTQDFFKDKKTDITPPSFINFSMERGINWVSSARQDEERRKNAYNNISRISSHSVFILSAGNSYPSSLNSFKNKISKNLNGIIVGSMSPSGGVSNFSQEGEEVHILAPSDHHITSVDSNGNYQKFGGTSGAAPLVTGSLAGFEWLSGYHPTGEEAKILLEKTATPTIYSVFEDPKRNGHGLLNSYKLGEVAKRLKKLCANRHQRRRRQCFKQGIRNPLNYQFSVDKNILEEIKNTFPLCSSQDTAQTTSCADTEKKLDFKTFRRKSRGNMTAGEAIKASLVCPEDCTHKKTIFKKLRQAVLLNVENVELWEKLRCIYEQEGFLENSVGVELTLFAVENLTNPGSMNLTSLSEVARVNLIYAVERINNPESSKLLQLLEKDPVDHIRLLADAVDGQIEDIKLMNELAKNSNKHIRLITAIVAGKIQNPETNKVLEILAEDIDKDVRRVIWHSVRKRFDLNIAPIRKKLSKEFEKEDMSFWLKD